MTRNCIQRVSAFVAIFMFSVASICYAQVASFTAALSGANEVPPNASLNNGNTFVTVNATTGTVTWNTTSTIPQASATGHHIHQQAAGINGPIVVNFGTAYSGTVASTTAIASAIIANPAGFYVNLHTAALPGGEIRAQLVPFATPVPGSVPALDGSLLAVLGIVLAGFGVFVFRRSKHV